MRDHGWSSGFLDLDKSSTYRAAVDETLLIVDYPEEQVKLVKDLLAAVSKSEYPNKLRILLLTRQHLSYWRKFFNEARCEDIVDYNVMTLNTIKPVDLYTIYNTTVEIASGVFNTIPPPLSEEQFILWVQSSPENKLPLFVMAAAVHAALNPEDLAVRYSGREAITALVHRELQRVEPLSVSLGFPRYTLTRVLSLSILAGGLDQDGLKACWSLRGIRVPDVSNPSKVMEASGMLRDGKLDPLKPDVVAAIVSADCLQHEDCDGPEWIWFAGECTS